MLRIYLSQKLTVSGWFQDEEAFWSDVIKIYLLVIAYVVCFCVTCGLLKGLEKIAISTLINSKVFYLL